MRTRLAYKSSVEKLAENTYALRETSTIQLCCPYGHGYGNVGPIGIRDPLRRWRLGLSSFPDYGPLDDISVSRYLSSIPKSVRSSSHLSSTPETQPPIMLLTSIPNLASSKKDDSSKISSVPKADPFFFLDSKTKEFLENLGHIGSTSKLVNVQKDKEIVEPMKPTVTFKVNLDNIFENLREINKIHPTEPEPLRDQLFGLKGEHGKVLEFVHNNQPVEDPFKLIKEYVKIGKL